MSSTIRPLATIAVLAALGVFLALKINEGPSVALEGDWPSDVSADDGAPPAWPVEAAAAPAAADGSSYDAAGSSFTSRSAPALNDTSEEASEGGYPPLPALPDAEGPSLQGDPPPIQGKPSDAELATGSAPPVTGSTADDPPLPSFIPQANYGGATPTDDPNKPAISGRVPSLGTSTPKQDQPTTTAPVERYGSAPASTPPPQTVSAFDAAWPQIQQALNNNKLTHAHLLLSQWRDDPSLSPTRRAEIESLLGDLAGTVVYSMEHLLEPPHQVQPGETLATIAEKYNVPWELLAKINGVPAADAVQPGQTLKVLRGPFTADVRLDRGEVVLLLADRYAGRFPFRVAGPAPGAGEWTVDQKRLAPPAATRYAAAAPPERKLLLRSPAGETVELSAATTASPGAGGHLAVASSDITDLYDILSVGSAVTIRR